MRAPMDRVHAVASLQEFFKDSVADAMAKQGVAADDHTAYYVVNLLTLFARHETLYDQAGLMLRIDERNWLKAGIEFVDGRQMLSVVATTHEWSTEDGRTTGRLEKALPQASSVDAGSH